MREPRLNVNSDLMGLFLGLSTWRFSIPIPLLDKLPVGSVLMVIVVVRYMLKGLLLKSRPVLPNRIVPGLVVFYGFLLAVVIGIKPPGVDGAGGIGEAFYFVLFAFAFFAFRSLAKGEIDFGRVLRIGFVLAILGLIINIGMGLLTGTMYVGLTYHYYSWLVAAIVLSLYVAKYSENRKFKVLLLFTVFLGLAILTPHRDRPFLALFNFMIILFEFKRTKLLSYLALWSFLFVLVTSVVGIGYQPLLGTRSLSPISTVLGMHDFSSGEASEGALGLSDPIRAVLYEYGFRHIKSHPILGEGFAIPGGLLAKEMQVTQSDPVREVLYALSVSGDYHNGILELAVKGGLPLAVLLLWIILVQSAGFFKWGRSLSLCEAKVFAAALSGYFVQVLGQMLINGGGNEVALLGGLLGLMSGFMTYWRATDESAFSRAV